MVQTSSHGNKIALSVSIIFTLSLISAVGSYRLKKTAEIKRWQKELASYSSQLENENQLAKATLISEDK